MWHRLQTLWQDFWQRWWPLPEIQNTILPEQLEYKQPELVEIELPAVTSESRQTGSDNMKTVVTSAFRGKPCKFCSYDYATSRILKRCIAFYASFTFECCDSFHFYSALRLKKKPLD